MGVIGVMTENMEPDNPVVSFKNAYFALLDQAIELAKQPIESTKKIMSAAFDTEMKAWNTMAKDPVMSPMRDMASMGVGYMELYSKRFSEGLEIAKKSSDVLTEIAISWQKIALDAQDNTFNAYKNYFNRFRT